jgi:hypothetical protein
MAQATEKRKAHHKAYQVAWNKAHPGYNTRKKKAWRDAHPKPVKIFKMRGSRHDISLAEYHRMRDEQDNKCKLCRKSFTEFKIERTFAANVDHKHCCPNSANHRNTLDVGGCAECIRGIICHQCNVIVVRFIEMYPDRQTAAERTYMADRPILRYRSEARE